MSSENQDDEITLKELILIVQDYSKEILRRWWIVGIIAALCIGFFLYKHYTHVVTYPYEIKFMVESDGNQPAVGGLLGQFGLGKRSANPIKIQEVARSNALFRNVVFSSKQNELLINHIIDVYDLNRKWSESNPLYENYRFTANKKNDEAIDLVAFKRLEGLVWKGSGNQGNALLSIGYNFDEGIFRMRSNTLEADLSKELANTLYLHVTDFFENEILKNKSKALTVLQSRLDSLDVLRLTKNLEIARFDDNSLGIISQSYKSKRNILQQDMLAISTTYSNVLQNKELAEFNLNSSKALFIVLDKTLEPLSSSRSNLKRKIIFGLVTGVFISVFLIIVMLFYRKVMKE